MDLRRLDPAGLRAMARALRAGDPVRLKLEGPPPRGLRLDEIAPLCHDVSVADPQLDRALKVFLPPPARPGRRTGVTVVVPCHRGPPRGLYALLGQDLPVRILVLSNGRGPENVPGAEVIRVPWEGHGPTRQRALDLVRDEFVFFTVADAIPLGAGFLRTLLEGLEGGPWDAVTARQVPWPDADPVTKDRLRAWTPAGTRPVDAPQVDNVAALYRTAALRRWPFPAVPIAEDLWWSQHRQCGYVPSAAVLHSHSRRPGALFRRNRAIHAERAQMGLPPTVPSGKAFVGALGGVVRPVLQAGPVELPNQLAELAGQWWGGRRGR